MSNHTNKLASASSPYLLQHAHNPVNWEEWNDEAFERAIKEDKLILVSIGYASCHWCHVMAHESFEDEQVAAIMNDRFVCIKVDREERPDIDQYCMDAVQLITGSGGWPLHCFLLPDGRPIHGGTYFRKQDWIQLLLSLSEFWKNEREQSLIYATKLTSGVKQINEIISDDKDIDFTQIHTFLHHWSDSFDKNFGGFNWAPKFPMPVNLNLFLDYGIMFKDEKFTDHVHLTLRKMAVSGIHDQIGGGFCRYSTDSYWKVPHFEKMLYDNAQLMSVYAKANMHQPNENYEFAMNGIYNFITSELLSSEGLIYSSTDADSNGVEGEFFCWSKKEITQLLGDQAEHFCKLFSISDEGNWELGFNIIHQIDSNEGDYLKLKNLKPLFDKLNTFRESRVHPSVDTKVILSWNALMVEGLADVYISNRNNKFLSLAESIIASIEKNLIDGDKIYRIRSAEKNSINAFSDDYANLISAYLKLYEASGNENYAIKAEQLFNRAIILFYNKENYLFRYSDEKDKKLNIDYFEIKDDVLPSSNAILAYCSLKLGFLFNKNEYLELNRKVIKSVLSQLIENFRLYPSMINLLMIKENGFHQLVMSKPIDLKNYLPGLIRCINQNQSQLPLLKEKSEMKTSFSLCCDMVCYQPTESEVEIINQYYKA